MSRDVSRWFDPAYKEMGNMKSGWFVVTCEVDNGCLIEKWQSIVNALTATQAKGKVYEHWRSQDSETTAKILSARKLSETEIIHMEVR